MVEENKSNEPDTNHESDDDLSSIDLSSFQINDDDASYFLDDAAFEGLFMAEVAAAAFEGLGAFEGLLMAEENKSNEPDTTNEGMTFANKITELYGKSSF